MALAAVIVLGAAVLVAVVGVWTATRTQWGRQAVLSRVAAVARASGLDVQVGDFELALRSGCLVLRDVRVGAPVSAPAFVAARIEVCGDMLSYATREPHIREVHLERWRFDPRAPWPDMPAEEASPAGPPRQITVERIRLLDGSIAAPALPATAAAWVQDVAASEIEIEGSFAGDRLSFSAKVGDLRIVRPGEAVWSGRLAAQGRVALDGPIELSDLSIQGPGLDASGWLRGAFSGALALEGGIRAELEPAALAPDLASGGHVEVTARGQFPELAGDVTLTAAGLPLDDLAPWLGQNLLDAVAARGTTADLSVHGQLAAGQPLRPAGQASLRWRRGDELLATAELELKPPGAGTSDRVRLVFTGAVLPDAEGERSVRGELLAASLGELASGQLAATRARLQTVDLVALHGDLQRAFPALLPALPDELPLAGALAAVVDLDGRVLDPRATAHATWSPSPGGSVRLDAAGHPLRQAGTAELTFEALPVALALPGAQGVLDGTLMASGTPASFSGRVVLDGRDLVLDAEAPRLDTIHLAAATDGHDVTISALDVRMAEMRVGASGRGALAIPISDVELQVEVEKPLPGVHFLEANLTLRHGDLLIEAPFVDTAAGAAAVRALVPLGTLASIPQLAGVLAEAPLAGARGPLHLQLWAADIDSCGLLQALERPDGPEWVRGGVAIDAVIDPADLTGMTASVELRDVQASTGEELITTGGPLRLALTSHEMTLDPVRLKALDAVFELGGSVRLAREWSPGESAGGSLVEAVDLRASGTIPTQLLTPYLAGGIARGELSMEARARGAMSGLRAVARISGPDVSFFWPTPYPTRIAAPDLDLLFANGELVLHSGRFSLNGGEATVSGKRYQDGFLELRTAFSRVPYLLDFGLKARLGADLTLTWEPAGRGLLAGDVVLERGLLDRDLDLDRDVLPMFLAPTQTAGTAESILESIDLDLTVETHDGLRVRNNIADLRASWDAFSITGTAQEPEIRGSVEVEPGGLVFAYGQTLRLDRAVATFTGDPINDPRIDLSVTSSLTDPSITQQASDPFAAVPQEGDSPDAFTSLATGLAGYYGERLTSQVSEQLGLGRITIRPVQVFGEADPSTRLTITRELSRYFALAFSMDLRDSQRQTLLLDVHGLRQLPRFAVQVFSSDEGNPGGTIQQVIELGGPKAQAAEGQELQRIDIETENRSIRRLARRAVRVQRGQSLGDGALFDTEVEIAQALRDAGYPEAEITIQTQANARHPERVDLLVRVAEGRRVDVRFEGDRPPRATRRPIATLYRLDELEVASREEMRLLAVRALRSLGFLRPEVRVEVTGENPRVVTVRSLGGERTSATSVRFDGVPEDEQAVLARRFFGPTERTELAAGLPEAERRILDTLRVLGYPLGEVLSRRLEDDGSLLVVELAPGPQNRVSSIELAGLEAADEARLRAVLPIQPGGAARLDRIAEAAAVIEQDLLGRGFPAAKVKAERVPDGAGQIAVRLAASPGESSRVASVEIAGARWTRPGWLRRHLDLDAGEPLDARRVAAARGRLLRTRLFSGVTSVTETNEDGEATVRFQLQEKPRFSVAYGFRWESDVGTAAVVDIVDQNLLGRGLIAGVRARWESNDRVGRAYINLPPRRGIRLETFFEQRREITRGEYGEGFVTDTSLGSLRLSTQLARASTAAVYLRVKRQHIYEQEPNPFFPFDITIQHPYLGLQLVHDTRNDPLQATSGMLASLDVSGSGDFLGSDYSYLRSFGQVNIYRAIARLAERPVYWAQSVRVGIGRAFAGQVLLTDIRFKAGGEFSVRGYPFEGLGPLEDRGGILVPVGGDALLVINEELRVTLPWDLTGVVFFDIGQVWAERSDVGRDLAKAVGLGLRASTPVGVLRFDIARPLDRRPSDPSYKIYVGFGNAF